MCGTYRLPSQREAKQQQIPSSYDEKCERFYVKSIFQSPVNRSQKLKKSLSAHHKKSNDSYDTKLRQEQICSLFDISFVGARHRFSLCFCFHFSKTIFFYCFSSSSLQIAKTVRLLGQTSVKRESEKGKMLVISN